MQLSTRQIGSLWNYIILNDMIAYQSTFKILSRDSEDTLIIEVEARDKLWSGSRPTQRLRLELAGNLKVLAAAALEQPISSDDTPEATPGEGSKRRGLEGPSSKEIADRAAQGRKAQGNGERVGEAVPRVP